MQTTNTPAIKYPIPSGSTPDSIASSPTIVQAALSSKTAPAETTASFKRPITSNP